MSLIFDEDFSLCPLKPPFPDGMAFGSLPWTSTFDGGGENKVIENTGFLGKNACLELSPAPVDNPNTTAALVVSPIYEGDPDLRVQLYTQRHLKGRDARPWEVGWIIWNYQLLPPPPGWNENFHAFYYATLKPNFQTQEWPFGGWEIGKRDPKYIEYSPDGSRKNDGQRILFTGPNPHRPDGGYLIQTWYDLRIQVMGSLINLYVDNFTTPVQSLDDPDPLPENRGGVGFYCEDADVLFSSASLRLND